MSSLSKKPVSPQAIESSEVIPSLLDMPGDIKHSQSNPGPLLPNPAHSGASGQALLNNSNSNWPVLDGVGSPTPGNVSKADHCPATNNKAQVRNNTALYHV